MTETIWVVGGEQRISFYKIEEWPSTRPPWSCASKDGRPERVLEYESPPEHCPEGTPSHIFKAATFQGDTAYLCTQTEVLVCDFPSFAIRRVISLPCFNDLHHVAPAPDGRLFVAVTGLDAVAELSPRRGAPAPGQRARRLALGPLLPRRRLPQGAHHQAPPGPSELHLLPRRAPLGHPLPAARRRPARRPGRTAGQPFDVGTRGIHDGHVEDGQLYFTTVDGCVVRFDLRTGEKTAFDLNTLASPDDDRPLGWCRGLLPMEDGPGLGRLLAHPLHDPAPEPELAPPRLPRDRAPPAPPHPRSPSTTSSRVPCSARWTSKPAGMGAVFSIHRA